MNKFRTPKEKYGSPSPEEVIPNLSYAFTINPNDDYQCYKSEHRVHSFVVLVSNFLANIGLDRISRYSLNVEISKKGRLHGHGYITFASKCDIYSFFVNVVHKLASMCTYIIKPIDNTETWEKYINKQSDVFTAIARGQPVITNPKIQAIGTIVDYFEINTRPPKGKKNKINLI